METKTGKKIKRSERTTRDQLEYYKSFCIQHPELEAKLDYLEAPHVKQKLWEQLARDLNVLRGPKRSALTWRKILIHWKNMVNSRDRKLKAERGVTGEGSSKIQIVAVEEEASQTFDSAAVEGVCLGFDEMQPDNDELNFSTLSPDMKPEPSSSVLNADPLFLSTLKSEPSTPPPTSPPPTSPLPSTQLLSESEPSDNECLPSLSEKQANTRRSRNWKQKRLDQLYELAINNIEAQKRREAAEQRREAAEQRREAAEQIREAAEQKRMAVETQHHKMLLASNLAIQKALEKMANAFTTLAESVAKTTNNK